MLRQSNVSRWKGSEVRRKSKVANCTRSYGKATHSVGNALRYKVSQRLGKVRQGLCKVPRRQSTAWQREARAMQSTVAAWCGIVQRGYERLGRGMALI